MGTTGVYGAGAGWAARLGGGQAPPGASAVSRVQPQPGTAAAAAAANWQQMRAQVCFLRACLLACVAHVLCCVVQCSLQMFANVIMLLVCVLI